MFSYGRFSLARLSLGDGGNIYKLRQEFEDRLNIVAGAPVLLDAAASFSAVIFGNIRGTSAYQTALLLPGTLHARCRGQVNIFTRALFNETVLPKIEGIKNIYIFHTVSEKLLPAVWGGKNIIRTDNMVEGLENLSAGGKNLLRGALVHETLTALAGGIRQATDIASFSVTLPPGAELRIDSDTFRVTLDGENVLYAQAGDWVNISRELLYLEIESATGGSLQGTIIYTERYL